eukprot:Opistho-2@74392
MAAAPDDTATEEYFKQLEGILENGCHEQKKATDCQQLGEFLQAVRKDLTGAAAAYTIGCDGMNMPQSCFSLGTLCIIGKGVPKDIIKGAQYYARACEMHNVESCNNLGLLHQRGSGGVPRDIPRAIALFKTACDMNYANGCFNLGALHLVGEGGGPSGSPSESASASAGGASPAPYKDLPRAFEYSVRACEMGHVYGCVNASRMASLGDGVPRDDALAKKVQGNGGSGGKDKRP